VPGSALQAIAVTLGWCSKESAQCQAFADGPRDLLDGKSEIAEFCVPHIGKMSLHTDVKAAKSTISKVRCLEEDFGVRIVLAHDVRWMGENADDALLSLLDNHLASSRGRIMRGDIP
jgi:hypothetical protein